MAVEHTQFGWSTPDPTCAHTYLLPKVVQIVTQASRGRSLRIVDLGCGNGYVTARLAALGHKVVGVDVSPDGIEIARATYPEVDFRVASIYDEHIADAVGPVDCVVALEVIEHLFYPRKLLEQAYRMLVRGGSLLCLPLITGI